MPGDWPKEVLKAQAVASRSYAWWTVLDSRDPNTTTSPTPDPDYDADDTVFYQAYLGAYNRPQDKNANEAVDETKGLVLQFNHEIIKAYFTADSGGYTEDAVQVFGTDAPFCQSKKEEYNLAPTHTDWKSKLSLVNLSRDLIEQKLIPRVTSIARVWVKDLDRTQSGRAARVSLSDSNGNQYSIAGKEFAHAAKLPSNFFKLTTQSANLNISGKGLGHGVGMAQIGALQYFKQFQWSFEKILNFYYTGVTLVHE